MKRWVVLAALTVAACGGSAEFDEDAVVEALRDGWPNATDEELRENQAQVFRATCTSDLSDRNNAVTFAMTLDGDDTRRILEAGCPERVAEFLRD